VKNTKSSLWKYSVFCLALTSLPAIGLCDQMVFQNVSGAGYPADSYYGNYYVSPYYGTDITTSQNNILLYCLDFDHEISLNQHWNASVHQVPTTQSGFNAVASSFQFGNVPGGSSGPTFVQPVPSGEVVTLGSWERYQVATHLFNRELGLLGPGMISNSAAFSRERAVYQYAVWEVFLENNYTTGGHTYSYYNDFMASFNRIGSFDALFKTDVKTVLDEALTHYSTADLAGWTVVSPIPANTPGSEQEFLSPSFATTPEPTSMFLIGTVAILIGAARFRRRAPQK
jgi:hypothetical protein